MTPNSQDSSSQSSKGLRLLDHWCHMVLHLIQNDSKRKHANQALLGTQVVLQFTRNALHSWVGFTGKCVLKAEATMSSNDPIFSHEQRKFKEQNRKAEMIG